jgi:hypothetical protein
MLVYANTLTFRGAGAEAPVFKAIGAWLKEQLGFGLHPDQLRSEGEHVGTRGEVRAKLRILVTAEESPQLYSWVLKFADEKVKGRQWTTEVGVKVLGDVLDLSCVVKTDEHSTLVASPVGASQPRLIRYVAANIAKAKDADFDVSVPGVELKNVGPDRDSYVALEAEIERKDRNGPIVLVSPTKDGRYLVNTADLQEKLTGLAQVVQISPEFNSYAMAGVLGEGRSAWGGAINLSYPPTPMGVVRGRLFLADTINGWGDTQLSRISHVLAWVTSNTNIPRLYGHIRPEGVMQLSLRRRMAAARERSAQMSAAQLRQELEQAAKQAAEQAKNLDDVWNECIQLEGRISLYKDELESAQDELAKKDFTIQSLKDQLGRAGDDSTSAVNAERLVAIVSRKAPPSPLECIELIEVLYGDRCVILASARSSAEKASQFMFGRELLDLLNRFVTTFRSALMEGGDNQARNIFGKSEYAANESETVMNSKSLKRKRMFEYEGKHVEMFRHLKIGVADDVTKTIRVHFCWDAGRKKLVIGHCGGHLPLK